MRTKSPSTSTLPKLYRSPKCRSGFRHSFHNAPRSRTWIRPMLRVGLRLISSPFQHHGHRALAGKARGSDGRGSARWHRRGLWPRQGCRNRERGEPLCCSSWTDSQRPRDPEILTWLDEPLALAGRTPTGRRRSPNGSRRGSPRRGIGRAPDGTRRSDGHFGHAPVRHPPPTPRRPPNGASVRATTMRNEATPTSPRPQTISVALLF